MTALFEKVFARFATEGEPLSFTPCNVGLINTTVFVKTDKKEYVLQKINTEVFKKPHEVMANIEKVTSHLKNKGFPTLDFVKTREGELFCEEAVMLY